MPNPWVELYVRDVSTDLDPDIVVFLGDEHLELGERVIIEVLTESSGTACSKSVCEVEGYRACTGTRARYKEVNVPGAKWEEVYGKDNALTVRIVHDFRPKKDLQDEIASMKASLARKEQELKGMTSKYD